MIPDEKVMCHHSGFEKSCRDMVVRCSCRKWIQVMGSNPNTGEAVNRWDCADAWLPLLLIENSQMQRQTGAAVESARNEAVKAAEMTCRVIAATAGVRVPASAQIEAMHSAVPQIESQPPE